MKGGLFLAGAIAVGWAASWPAQSVAETTAQPEARVQTAPVPHKGDAADDPAVWIHPQEPELSLILGTDKQGGLHTYNMDGSAHELVSDAARPNNVDVLYEFNLDGRPVDLAVASIRGGKKGTGVKVWGINATNRHLSDLTEGAVIGVLGGKEPMSCPTSRQFARGVFVVQDGTNAGGNQNFKLYAWEDVAGSELLIDTNWRPRSAAR